MIVPGGFQAISELNRRSKFYNRFIVSYNIFIALSGWLWYNFMRSSVVIWPFLCHSAVRKEMRVSYNKLWKLLIDKNMKKMDLLEAVEMSPNTLAKFGRNENVSMDVITRICEYFKCDVGDIMEMIPNDE